MLGAISELKKLKTRRENFERKNEDEYVKLTIRVPKFMKDMMKKVVKKSSYNSIAELVREGIDKELDLQMNKENLDFIIKELDKLIDAKLDPFIKSQRKLNVNYARTAAINTYMLGEVFSKMLGDEFHEEFIKILSGARKKANYFVNKNMEGMSKKDLYDFYYIGYTYRNE